MAFPVGRWRRLSRTKTCNWRYGRRNSQWKLGPNKVLQITTFDSRTCVFVKHNWESNIDKVSNEQVRNINMTVINYSINQQMAWKTGTLRRSQIADYFPYVFRVIKVPVKWTTWLRAKRYSRQCTSVSYRIACLWKLLRCLIAELIKAENHSGWCWILTRCVLKHGHVYVKYMVK